MKQLLSLFLFLNLALFAPWSFATSAMGLVTMKVIRPLFIESKEPLAFATATPGAEPDQVEPGDPGSGVFLIRGEANTAYQINLPEQILLVNQQSSVDSEPIEINNFTSFPASAGQLSAQGEQILFIGATRGAIPANQEVGPYVGTYTIDIIY